MFTIYVFQDEVWETKKKVMEMNQEHQGTINLVDSVKQIFGAATDWGLGRPWVSILRRDWLSWVSHGMKYDGNPIESRILIP